MNNQKKIIVLLALAMLLCYCINNKSILPNSGNLPKDVELLTTEIPNSVNNSEDSSTNNIDVINKPKETTTDVQANMVDTKSDDNLINNVLNNDSCNLENNSECNNTSVTSQRMSALAIENKNNQLQFNSNDYLPQEKNKNWFETDFSKAEINVNDDGLLHVTDKYNIGVNTVGQSLKNPSYDLRAAPSCPKFTVSPWLQSTITPDTNLKSII